MLVGSALQPLDPEAITEDVSQSFFSSASGRKPADGETVAAPDKSGAYSWLKAPRYRGQVMEVGPLARTLVAYHDGQTRPSNPRSMLSSRASAANPKT